jgi:hypothetical protein
MGGGKLMVRAAIVGRCLSTSEFTQEEWLRILGRDELEDTSDSDDDSQAGF